MRMRTGQEEARKRWPKAEWICGRGRYALLAHCWVLTVSLHETRAAAEKQKEWIDKGGCGGCCSKRHEIVELNLGTK